MSRRAQFRVSKQIGKGSYGRVYRVRRRSDSKVYAMKEINIKYLSHREREEAVNEIRLLASVNHPNIIAYYESFLEDDKLSIITEYAPYGDLYQAIQARKSARKRFSENTVWSYFIQLCHALRVLHTQNILHRDLKSPNVFIAEDGKVKLGDLGVAKLLKNAMTHTQIGTPYYLSPEIWKNQPYNDKSDIWSLGVLLFEMVTLRHPFDADNQRELSLKVIGGKYTRIPSSYSPDMAEMIALCLNVNPRLRPSIDQILRLPIITKRMNLVDDHDDIDLDGTQCQVMDTIKVPRQKNLTALTKALPKPMYMTSPAKLGREKASRIEQANNVIEDVRKLPELDRRAPADAPDRRRQRSESPTGANLPRIRNNKQHPEKQQQQQQQQQRRGGLQPRNAAAVAVSRYVKPAPSNNAYNRPSQNYKAAALPPYAHHRPAAPLPAKENFPRSSYEHDYGRPLQPQPGQVVGPTNAYSRVDQRRFFIR